jgi:hypothetical protein
VAQIAYPNGFSVAVGYTNGFQTQLYQPGTPGNVYWSANAYDEWGQVYDESTGNGVSTGTYRDPATGMVDAILAGDNNAVANYSYAWDANGNTTQRVDYNQGASGPLTETFSYDNVDRLLGDDQTSGSTTLSDVTVGYDSNDLGNIASKSDIGSYAYAGTNNAGPHAVTTAGPLSYTYDAVGNMTSVSQSGITVTAYEIQYCNKRLRLRNPSFPD